MINTLFLAATLLCSGYVTTNKGTKQHVKIMLKNISDESLEMGLAFGSLTLLYDNRFAYSAQFDDFGSMVEIKLGKRTGKAHYMYLNFGSDRELKSAASGWLSCRNL